MANLRDVAQQVEQRSKRKHARGSVDLPLPLYEGTYAARFGVLDGERLTEFEQAATRELSEEEALELNAEFVADACRTIGVVEGGKFDPLRHDDGRAVRFDQDFAELLSLERADGEAIDSMAGVVLAVWTVEEDDGEGGVKLATNVAALSLFAQRLLVWMQDTNREVEGELAGGSSATRQ